MHSSPIVTFCLTFLCLSLCTLSACGSSEGTPGYGASPILGEWTIVSATQTSLQDCDHGDLMLSMIGMTMLDSHTLGFRQFAADLTVNDEKESSAVFHLICQMYDASNSEGTFIAPIPFDCTVLSERPFAPKSNVDAAYKLTLSLSSSLDQIAFNAQPIDFSGSYSRFQDGAYTLTTTEGCEGSDCGTEAAVGPGVCVASGEVTASWSGCGDPDAMCADSAEQLE